jgi:hypothetical protein
MTRSLVVVCEARADFETASALADRVLCSKVEWIEAEVLANYRRWRGLQESESFLTIQHVPALARQKNILARGHFDGKIISPDELLGRRAFSLLYTLKPLPDAVLLIRDDDRQSERKDGLEQARKWTMERLHGLRPIVLGLAHPKRESWVLAGYEAKNQDEHELLDTVRRELGFHPCTEAGQLTAKHGDDKRSAKRILAYLTKDDPNREAECWNAAPLSLLHDRGKSTGLADYLRELESFLIPLFDPAAPAKV